MGKLELLKGVRDLLAIPDHWAKDYYAYDKYRNTTGATSDKATCWCMQGAAIKVSNESETLYFGNVEQVMSELMVGCVSNEYAFVGGEAINVAVFNDADATTHEDVLKALDCAIEREQANASQT